MQSSLMLPDEDTALSLNDNTSVHGGQYGSYRGDSYDIPVCHATCDMRELHLRAFSYCTSPPPTGGVEGPRSADGHML